MEQKKKSGFGNTVAYVKRHWQLYVFFLLPALLLTLIFKYIPMGGVLIAFMDYNPVRGILGSWTGTFQKIFIITGLYEIFSKHIEA